MPPMKNNLADDTLGTTVSVLPPSVTLEGSATVPVNVGLAVSALVLMAVDMLSNSVSNSEPLITLFGLPLESESFASKSVVLV